MHNTSVGQNMSWGTCPSPRFSRSFVFLPASSKNLSAPLAILRRHCSRLREDAYRVLYVCICPSTTVMGSNIIQPLCMFVSLTVLVILCSSVSIYVNFLMPSELVEIRRNRFEGKFIDCCNVLYYFGINKTM